ncbi:MAG: RMD1 family protein [Candidatus Midichloria sp.]|nr:RMD1 family protein [Candidatus Midichloria sp.]
MQCASYCTGRYYNLFGISEHFSKLGIAHKVYGKDVLYIESEHLDINHNSDVFVFNYGCVIFWGLDPINEEKVLNKLSEFLEDEISEAITDRCNYVVTPQESSYVDEESDTIVLDSDDPHIKLSFSYGLSQSVKLSVFEASVEKTIDDNKKIPNELIQTGKISMSRKALAKKIGTLFAERNFINLNSDILDTPDFFWRRPKYEPYYEMAVQFMDIKQRLIILNSRLKIIHELYEILSTELHHIHSSRLELIIIYLIFIEVMMAIMRDFFHLI